MLLISSNSIIALWLHRNISIPFCKKNGGLVKQIKMKQTKHWVYTNSLTSIVPQYTDYNIKLVMNLSHRILRLETRIDNKATHPYHVTTNINSERNNKISNSINS